MKVSGFKIIVKAYFYFVGLQDIYTLSLELLSGKGHIVTLKVHLFFCWVVTTTNKIGQEHINKLIIWLHFSALWHCISTTD